MEWHRPFRLYHMTIGSRSLLLDSFVEDASPRRVSVAFYGVSKIRMDVRMTSLSIEGGGDPDPGVRVFRVNDGEVWAESMAWIEDDPDEPREPSALEA
ncbi:hypothetical protein STSO111631_06715 [Stackebrandtia soli]